MPTFPPPGEYSVNDFPANHWALPRTTNPIESTFATVRLRTVKTKGNGSRSACVTMAVTRMESAAKGWRLLNGSPLLAKVVAGITFVEEEGKAESA